MSYKTQSFRKTARRVTLVVVMMVVYFLVSGSFLPVAESKIRVEYPSFQWGEPGNSDYLLALKKAFEEENPNVEIGGESVPIAAYWDKMYSRTAAGNPPDILTLFDTQLAQYIDMDALEPLDKWLDEVGFDRTKFIAATDVAVVDGKTYAIIFQTNPRCMLYNKKLFKEAGVDVPTNPWEFISGVDKLSNPERRQYGYAYFAKTGDPMTMYRTMIPWIRGLGGSVTTNDVVSVNEPPFILAAQLHKTLYDREYTPRGVDLSTYRQMFWQGKVASLITGAFLFGFIKKSAPEMYPNIDAVVPPFANPTMTLNCMLTIPKQAKHKEEAAKFLLMLLRPDWQKKVIEIIRALPTTKIALPEGIAREVPWLEAFVEAGKTAHSFAPRGLEKAASEVVDMLMVHFEDILFKDVPVKTALDEAQKELENFVKTIR